MKLEIGRGKNLRQLNRNNGHKTSTQIDSWKVDSDSQNSLNSEIYDSNLQPFKNEEHTLWGVGGNFRKGTISRGSSESVGH